jgi:hypothetical protein
MKKHFPPAIAEAQFDCAHCGVYADQVWFQAVGRQGQWIADVGSPPPPPGSRFADPYLLRRFQLRHYQPSGSSYVLQPDPDKRFLPPGNEDLVFQDFYISVCVKCQKPTFWRGRMMIHPLVGGVQPPNADMNEDIRRDYEEAASVLAQSPRSAVALLRLCVQKLCCQLGLPGQNLNQDIATLVQRGLSPDIQKALDAVRVIGNNAVHPLVMDLRDDRDTAVTLFALVNFIADQMITFRNQLNDVFDSLPEGARAAIDKRDGRA